MCSLDNFARLLSGSVSNTIEQQGIADPSDLPRGRGTGNKPSNFNKKTIALSVNQFRQPNLFLSNQLIHVPPSAMSSGRMELVEG